MSAILAGQRLTADLLNIYVDRPAGVLQQATTQSIPDNTATNVTFGTGSTILDSHGYHSESTNNTRVTPTKAGWYRVKGLIFLPSRTDYATIYLVVLKNGSQQAPLSRQAFGGTSASGARTCDCEAIVSSNGSTDYFEIQTLVDNTGNTATSTNIGGSNSSYMEWEYIREL